MIEGKNLKLRPIEEEDLEQLRNWRNADFIRAIAREYRPLNMLDQKKWFESLPNSNHIMFAIENANKQLIGCCGITYIDWKNGQGEISFYMGKEKWQESMDADVALQLLMNYGFNELRLHGLYGIVFSYNTRSINWLERNSFKLDGMYRESRFWNGKYYDELLYSILGDEFNSRENMESVYNNLARKFKFDAKTLHWGTKERQELSFKGIIDAENLNNSNVLDVGCGFGELYIFLKNHKINVDYTGVDISDEIIKLGKENYPELKDKIKVFDILKDDIGTVFDYVIISGIFNIRSGNNWDFLKSMIKKSFEICNKGVLFNSISTYVDFEENHLYYVDPCDVFRYCKTLTKWVNIKHDYNDYEYTTSMFKEKK